MFKIQCPKCKSYKTVPVGLKIAEMFIVIGIILMVYSFFRPKHWYFPLVAFIIAVIFYIPSLAQHYVCKNCGHKWNAKEQRSGLKWGKKSEGPNGDRRR